MRREPQVKEKNGALSNENRFREGLRKYSLTVLFFIFQIAEVVFRRKGERKEVVGGRDVTDHLTKFHDSSAVPHYALVVA